MASAQLAAELMSPRGRENPYPIYRQLHALGPAVAVPGGALVSGYAAVDEALRDRRLVVEDASYLDKIDLRWRTHASRRLLSHAMVFANGVAHDRMRRLVHHAFTPARVEALRPVIEHEVVRLLDRMATVSGGQGEVEFVSEFAFALPVNVIGHLLGIPAAERAAFRRPVADLAAAFEPGWLHADVSAADRAADDLSSYFTPLINERRARPGEDLLTAMIVSNEAAAEPLSDQELTANAVFLMLAGFETTVGLLGNGLCLLLNEPDLLARLRDHPDQAPGFVEEILRYEAPVQLTGRRATQDVHVGGLTVPAGGSVIVLLGAANRDPHRFADADRFDPDRRDNQPLSFSGGAHYCLGARLARLEATVALPMVLARFPGLALAGAPTRLNRFNLRAFANLPVALG
jgi:cytochrome P450